MSSTACACDRCNFKTLYFFKMRDNKVLCIGCYGELFGFPDNPIPNKNTKYRPFRFPSSICTYHPKRITHAS